MSTLPRSRRSRRGAALVLVAVSMVALLGMAALAVDIGMAFTARSEAQRVADASALAGGSAFLDVNLSAAEAVAEERAYEYALANTVRNVGVDSSEVDVDVILDSMKVRVTITRETLPTWFARLLGIDDVDVAARAAAQAFQAGEARCLKPFAVPDVWYEDDSDNIEENNVWDPGEEWDFNPEEGDYYTPFGGQDDLGGDLLVDGSVPTGYGSLHRGEDRDYGRQVEIKMSDPNDEFTPQPGLFLPWAMPSDSDQEECSNNNGGGGGGGGGGGNDDGESTPGGAAYRQNICACNNYPVQLGVSYDVEPGNMIGPTRQGISDLVAQDPEATWDPDLGTNGGISGSAFGNNGLASPRVVKVALFDPTLWYQNPGRQDVQFNNFALFFIEGQESGAQAPVVARFLYFASGTGEGTGGPNTGSLVLYLRLVE